MPLIVALAIAALALEDPNSSPPDQKVNARTFLSKLEDKIGRRLANKEYQGYDDFAQTLKQHGGPDQIMDLRVFVKMIGPVLLDKPEYAVDGPLHEVLLRAEEILGVEGDPDQDKHPHRKGMELTRAIKVFFDELQTAYNYGSKDEL